MRKPLVVSTAFALFCAAAAQSATIQENTVFPEMDIIASQEIGASSIGIRDIPNPIHAICGQTFTITNATTLRAITLKANSSKTFSSGDDMVELWIGADADPNPTNFVAGATSWPTSFDLNGVTLTAGKYYTINLDSDISLPAGDYAFQLKWENTGAAHQMFFARANGDGDYDAGGLVYAQTTDGSFVDFPLDTSVSFGLDMVFGLHSAVVGTVPTFSVDPASVDMLLVPPNDQVTGTVAVVYTADSTMDISMSVSAESHPGSFSLLSANPQTLTEPSPSNTILEIEFDNTVSNLVAGESATGLITIAWSETGSGTTNETVVPVSASTGFAPNANNTFMPLVGTWGDPANWSLGRVPGTAGADRGIIQGAQGRVCNVETNFSAPFGYRVWVRTTGGTPNTVNVGADLKGSADISVGQASGQYGVLNQTAGDVDTDALIIGDPDGTAPSNSYYNLSGGTLTLDGDATLYSTGEMDITGGTMDISGDINIGGTGVLNIDGGALSQAGNGTIDGLGTLKLQSGSFSTGNNTSGGQTFEGNVEISGGAFSMLSQTLCYDPASITVKGDEASITMRHIQTTDTYGNFGLTLNYDLDETGVSTINMSEWMFLQKTKINVDGSAYTGGSQTINLIDGKSINGLAATSNITVTGFSGNYTASVEQDTGSGNVILTISAGPYEDWTAEYNLSGTNALASADPDGDLLSNLYEYGLGGDPTNGSVLGMDSSMVSGSGYIDYVHVRRVEATNDISYELALNQNLVVGSWTTNSGYSVVGYGPVVGDFDTVTNRIITTGKTAEFIDLVIEELP